MKRDITAALEAAAAQPRRSVTSGLSREDGAAIINAIRAGVKLDLIAKALGVGRLTLQYSLGTWAVRYAELPEAEK